MKVFLIALMLVACTPVIQTEYITTQLSHDPRPVLPKITPEELDCLDKTTYQKLYDRQRLITSYAIDLETIIDSTKEVKK